MRTRREIECPIAFADVEAAERAFLGAGPTQLAITNSGQAAVAEAIRAALVPFTDQDGRFVLPACRSRGRYYGPRPGAQR